MWTYEKKLQYPVKIKNPNPKLAQVIISQLGGADGELAASMRYLHQRYSSPYNAVTGILTDVGTEELAHLEIVAAILYQLTRNLTPEQIEGTPFATYFVDHTTGLYPIAASGVPFDMKYVGIKGDILTDLNEDLAADAAILQEQPKTVALQEWELFRKITSASWFSKDKGLTEKRSALDFIWIPAQALSCGNRCKGIAKLNEYACQKRDFVNR